MASNPSVFPRIWREYRPQEFQHSTFEFLFISETENKLLNRPEQPCEEDPDYGFIVCVKNSQARRVGCRPVWDIWSDTAIPICSDIKDIILHETMDFENFNYERKIVESKTGCKVPCNYREFAIAGEPQYVTTENNIYKAVGGSTEKKYVVKYCTVKNSSYI